MNEELKRLLQPGGDTSGSTEGPILNGVAHHAERQVEDAVVQAYSAHMAQLGAVLTLLTAQPLDQLAKASKRLQSQASLLAPPGATIEQITVMHQRFRNDGRLIEAARNLLKTYIDIVGGH